MIPGEIFTGFAEFQGIVSVNDLWLPRRLQELDPQLSNHQNFRFGHDCTSTFSARFPGYFRLQTDIQFGSFGK